MDASLLTGGLSTAGIAAAAALASGFFGSGHCALMCGPLACADASTTGSDGRQRRKSAWAWQLGRLGAYAGVGAVLGGLGRVAVIGVAGPATRALPWIMAVSLVVAALRVGKRERPLPALAQIPRKLARAGAHLSPSRRAALRGAATPFLPCGLLYGGFLMAAAAGSVVGGALVMTAFGVGAVPALALVQTVIPGGAARLGAHPRLMGIVRRAVPLAAALVLVWRALAVGGGAAPPHCH